MASSSVPVAPTEETPLLREDAPPCVSDTPARDAELDRPGNPAMAAKMHLILPAIGVGLYLVAVDGVLTAASYAKMGNDLNALNNMSWVATAYFLTLTSFQPLYGKLCDIFGRKECLLFAYVVFGLGCLGCGLARSIVELCVARAVAGIGGGGMTSVVSILMSDIVALRDRGLWQGYINVIFCAGTSSGAPLGGFLADTIGWRWSFIAQAPLMGVAFLAVYFVVDLPRPSHDHLLTKIGRIDFLGAFALVAAVVALLFGLDSGSNNGWSRPVTYVPLALTPVLFAAFVLIEAKVAKNPFAPGRIIFQRALFGAYAANFFGSIPYITSVFYLPLYFQAVMSYSATVSASLLVPSMISAVVASLFGGWVIKRTGKFYAITIISYAVLVLSTPAVAASMWYKSTSGAVVMLVVSTFAGACGITTTLVGLLANASTEDTAVVVACSYLFRSLGSSIGISASSAVLQQVLRGQLAARLPDGYQAKEIEQHVRENLDYIKELPTVLADIVRTCYQISSVAAFGPAVLASLFAFLATFLIKERPLKGR